jgi:hypothetical protein
MLIFDNLIGKTVTKDRPMGNDQEIKFQEIKSHIFQEVESFINICDYFSGN